MPHWLISLDDDILILVVSDFEWDQIFSYVALKMTLLQLTHNNKIAAFGPIQIGK